MRKNSPPLAPSLIPLALIHYVTGLVVVFATPENILGYAWAREFVNLMSFIPYVERVGHASSAHAIAPFFAAVMYAIGCAVVLLMWRFTSPSPEKITNYQSRVPQTLKWVGVHFFMLTFVVMVTFFPDFDSRYDRLQISSRIGMAVYGSLILTSVSFFVMATIIYIKNWRHIVYGDIDGLIKKHNSKFHKS